MTLTVVKVTAGLAGVCMYLPRHSVWHVGFCTNGRKLPVNDMRRPGRPGAVGP